MVFMLESNDSTALSSAPESVTGWLEGFRRITSSGDYIPEIDGLRFIAISLVVFYHVLVFVRGTLGMGLGNTGTLARGVEMFYVLSGFILAAPFAAYFLRGTRKVSLTRYFIRRVTRLEPPYLLCLVIYAVIKFAQEEPGMPGSTILRNTLLGAVYLHDLVLGRPGMIVSVAWSLEVEVQFYLVMPLLAYVFAVQPTWLRRAILIVAAIAPAFFQRIWLPAALMRNDGHLLNFIQYFLAGLLLADVWVVEWRNQSPPLRQGVFSVADLICLIGLSAILIVPRHDGSVTRLESLRESVGLPMVIFLIYLGVFRSVWMRRLMRLQWITLIGGMCYSIYLMHNLAIVALGRIWQSVMPKSYQPAALLSCLVMPPFCLVVSAFYFRLIERPCMRKDWPQRLWLWFSSRLFVDVRGDGKL
jgi:peptidoglycan/LPS O-acetylase OafA/YrhL